MVSIMEFLSLSVKVYFSVNTKKHLSAECTGRLSF